MFDPSLLTPWGWPSSSSLSLSESPAHRPARVLAQHRGAWLVHDGTGTSLARLSGSLRHAALSPEQLPAVGDWVLLEPGAAVIRERLPRRSTLLRRQPGNPPRPQILAANVDTALLVCGLDRDFNPRRIERALAQLSACVDRIALILSKGDLCLDPAARLREVRHLGAEAVILLSVQDGWGLEALEPFLVPASTLVLLGSSGAGKSTLLNALLGEERQRTREVRLQDQRGRHTTTHRELFPLPQGALLIDTPGLREWQLWDADPGLERTFEELSERGLGCRFRDCRHEGEPGCAVAAALEAGSLDPGRVENYRKLRREADYQGSLEDESLRRARKAREKELSRAIKRYEKS
jgi:ribosome biogenesis GTPase